MSRTANVSGVKFANTQNKFICYVSRLLFMVKTCSIFDWVVSCCFFLSSIKPCSLFYVYWMPGKRFSYFERTSDGIYQALLFSSFQNREQLYPAMFACLVYFREQRKIFHVNHIYLPQMQNYMP